jgi:hypothetical protein
MSIRTKADLKNLFKTGDKPDHQAFTDLIDILLENYHSSLSTNAHGGIVASNDIRLTNDRTPVGTIIRGGPNTPTGYTPCNGTLLNKTANHNLYTVRRFNIL